MRDIVSMNPNGEGGFPFECIKLLDFLRKDDDGCDEGCADNGCCADNKSWDDGESDGFLLG
jgi:hypothetical protein